MRKSSTRTPRWRISSRRAALLASSTLPSATVTKAVGASSSTASKKRLASISSCFSSRIRLIAASSTSPSSAKPLPSKRWRKPWLKSAKRTASMKRASSMLVRWIWRQSIATAPATSRPATIRAAPRSGRPSAATKAKVSAISSASRQPSPIRKRWPKRRTPDGEGEVAGSRSRRGGRYSPCFSIRR